MKTQLNLRPKPTTRDGVVRQSTYGCENTFNAEVEPKQSIRIYGTFRNHVNGPQVFDKTFKIGDRCEYDSYNLIYTGPIVAIGENTVSVRNMFDKVTRLDLFWFANKNWDFDAQKISEHNAAERMCI